MLIKHKYRISIFVGILHGLCLAFSVFINHLLCAIHFSKVGLYVISIKSHSSLCGRHYYPHLVEKNLSVRGMLRLTQSY